jgi:magnesium transporter
MQDGEDGHAARDPGAADRSIVDCALYEHGERRGGKVALEEALETAAGCREGFVWIGLHDPTAEMVERVGEHFELPPLAVEDAAHAHQRAKLEIHEQLLFLVLKTARYVDSDELVEIGEVMVFASPRFIITVRHGEGTPLHEVRLDLEQHPELLGIGPSAVLYAIADRIVDDYALVINGIETDIDEVEAEVFSGTQSNPAERIYKLKREVLEFRRAVAPLIAPVQRLTDPSQRMPVVDERTSDYFRDVGDHLVRDSDRIAGFDDLLTGVLQANLAQISVRDNQDMRRISAWVAIAAVPTMVFGLYGMNFDHMPELHYRFGYPLVVAATLSVCFALYRRFKASGWL